MNLSGPTESQDEPHTTQDTPTPPAISSRVRPTSPRDGVSGQGLVLLVLAVALGIALAATAFKARRAADDSGAGPPAVSGRLPTLAPETGALSGDGSGIVPGPAGSELPSGERPGGSGSDSNVGMPGNTGESEDSTASAVGAGRSDSSGAVGTSPSAGTADDAAGGSGGSIVDNAMAWYLSTKKSELTAPGSDATPETFEVAAGEALASVTDRLEADGFIRNAETFRLLARVRGADTGVQAGRHTLRRNMTAEEVLRALQAARADSVTVTIPEGWRAEEVAGLLAQKGLVDLAEFTRMVLPGGAETPELARQLATRTVLGDRPPEAGLEGYLFPDTYSLEPGAGALKVLETLLDTFQARFTPEMQAQATVAKLSIFQVVTLASIVEREAVVESERGKVARVYLNRLAEPPYILNADPTLQYALGFQPESNTWWKRPLLATDLKLDSPYNSYTRAGLPPGPIASPGLASLQAVLDPEPGDWQYFVANDVACDGTHVFAETYAAHLQNVATYQQGGCRP